MTLTRRSLIGASGAGIAIGVLDLASYPAAAHASSGGGEFSIVDRKTMPLTTYSADWSTQHTLSAPVYLELSQSAGSGGDFAATIAFDAGLFEPSETVDLFQGSSVRTVVVAVGATLPDGRAQATFGMDRGLGDDESSRVNFAIPLIRRQAYPSENSGAAAPLSLTVTSTTGVTTLVRQWVSIPGRSGLTPWAADVTAGWSEVPVIQAGKAVGYRFPSAIHILSVGPFAVPPGTLTVAVDPRAIATVGLLEATLDGVPIVVTTTSVSDKYTRELSMSIVSEIPAGSTVVLRIVGEGIPGDPALATTRHATALFTTAAGPLRPRRAGGIVELTDLTSSGNPLVPETAK